MTKMYKSKEYLRKRYILDHKTPKEIATECGVSVETIYLYLSKFGLTRRSR